MNSLKLIAVFALGFTLFSATSHAELPATEFVFGPFVNYSTYDGNLVGVKAGFGVSVSTRWQFVGEATYATGSGAYSKYDLRTGIQYNFSDSLRNSFYAGGGVGFTSRVSNSEKTNTELYFVRAGYRMKISENFNWSPNISVTAEPSRYGLGIDLLNFSIIF